MATDWLNLVYTPDQEQEKQIMDQLEKLYHHPISKALRRGAKQEQRKIARPKECEQMGEKKEIIKIVYEYVVVEEDEDSGVFSEIVGEGRVLAKSADDVRLVVAAGLGPEQIEGKVVLVRPFCR